MRVTFLTPTLELYGGNLVLKQYADFLVEQGHEVAVITSNKPKQIDFDSKVKIFRYDKFPFRGVDYLTFQLVYLSKIAKLVNDCDFLIPVYTPLIIPVIWAKKRKRLGAKIVLLFQDFFEMFWVGPLIKLLLRTRFVRQNIENAIAVSDPIALQYQQVSNNKVTVIKNGIEHEVFYDRKLPKERYLLFVGRPRKAKGFDIFLSAFKTVNKAYPELKAIVVAPDIKEHFEVNLEFISYKDREQLARLYGRALIYVNASRGESFCLPALEAMACGTAVVVADTVGSREYAKHDINCLVVPVNNAEAIANAIIALNKDASLRRKLEINGAITARKYNWEESRQRLARFLAELRTCESAS